MKSVLMFQFLLVFSSGICWAADKPAPLVKPSFPEKREMKYMFEHTLRREKSEDYIQVRLVLPQTEAGRQTIRRLKITPKQHRTIQEGDTKIAVWDWKSPDPVKIRIEVNADIYHHSLRSLLKNPPRRYHRLKINDRKGFLRPEKYQEVDDPLIIAEAEKIAQGVDDKETVLNILTHVTEILQNGGWSKGDLGAKVTSEQKWL